MKLIADEDMAGIETIALAINWGLSDKCQVEGCNGGVFAIMCLSAEETKGSGALRLVICRGHYLEGKEKGCLEHKFRF